MSYKIVMVEWLDPEGESGWMDIKNCADHEIIPVVSIGWLICENNRWVVLASALRREGEECSSIDFIPVGCIVRRRVLWHPDTDQSWREMWEKPFHKPEHL